jgi:hypothetical protein
MQLKRGMWTLRGDSKFPIASATLVANSTNISFILHAFIQQPKDLALVANAVLAFSWSLYWVHPNGDLLEMLLSARINKLDQRAKAQCLRCLGNILQM